MKTRILQITTAAFILCTMVAIAASAEQPLPTLYVIGDSTVNNPTKGLQGWGTPLTNWFDLSKINVQNRARGGRSSRTYLTEGIWDEVLTNIKPGDFVLMQFGHNDGGSLTNSRARASLKGDSEQTQIVKDEKTGKEETVHTYGWYLRKYITDAKAKGATPIVLSLVPRNIWTKDGKVTRAANDYGKWAREAAESQGVAFVDLNEIIAKHYEDAGQDKVKTEYFGVDHTHTTPSGAELNAASVVEGLRALQDCKLTQYLSTKPLQSPHESSRQKRNSLPLIPSLRASIDALEN